jgi:hypothetical protein
MLPNGYSHSAKTLAQDTSAILTIDDSFPGPPALSISYPNYYLIYIIRIF